MVLKYTRKRRWLNYWESCQLRNKINKIKNSIRKLVSFLYKKMNLYAEASQFFSDCFVWNHLNWEFYLCTYRTKLKRKRKKQFNSNEPTIYAVRNEKKNVNKLQTIFTNRK